MTPHMTSVPSMPAATPTRRELLSLAAAVATAPSAFAEEAPIPIIDTHFHIYDPTRPQGAPFPRTPNAPPFMPKDFRESAIPLGIVGGIEVEASPWVEDNLWVLMMIESEPMIVGTVGNLDPSKPEFREYLDRYHSNKLFLGIRYGNVWENQNLVAVVDRPELIDNMKVFAQTGLTFEVANPRFNLIEATVKLTDRVPDLRVVLGHLQALPLPTEPLIMKSYTNNLKELSKRNVYVKVSGIPRSPTAAQGVHDPAIFKPAFDLFWDTFGEDRIVYAGRNKAALEVLQAYCKARGRSASERFFWRNSIPAFRWVRRDSKQPQLA